MAVAAQIVRRAEPAGDGEIGALAGALDHAQLQHLPGLYRHGLAVGDGRIVQQSWHRRAGEGDERIRQKAQSGAGMGEFQRHRIVRVAEQRVGVVVVEIIHRPAGGNADFPIAQPPGQALQAGLRARVQHARRQGREGEVCQAAGGHLARHEFWQGQDVLQIIEIGLDAENLALLQAGL